MKKHICGRGWSSVKKYGTVVRHINEKGWRLISEKHISGSQHTRETAFDGFFNSGLFDSLPSMIVIGVLRDTGPGGTPGPYLGDFISLHKAEFEQLLELHRDKIVPEFFAVVL